MSNFIDEIMDFDPQNLTVFNEPEKKDYNPNVYKTSPSLSKAEDGHYRSKVRVLYNPFDVKQSIVKSHKYSLNDADGFFQADTVLVNDDKSCPIFKAWKKLWFAKDKDNKEFCKSVFQQTKANYVLVQILEDENQPELVGQFKAWKLPKVVLETMTAKMNPPAGSNKKAVKLMDWVLGKTLEIDVTPGPDDPKQPNRKTREISYQLCAFTDDSDQVIRTDGTPLLTDAELEVVENYIEAKTKLEKAKSEADKAKKLAEAQALVPQMKDIYAKVEAYLKENAIDIVEECGNKPWSSELTARVNNWISIVLTGVDPKTVVTNPLTQTAAATPVSNTSATQAAEVTEPATSDADLPF